MMVRRQSAALAALLLFSLLGSPLRAAESKAQADTGNEATAQRKVARAVSVQDIARKHMELAEVYAEAIADEKQCELNAFETRLLEEFYRAKEADSAQPIPGIIEKVLGERASFKFYRNGWKEKFSVQDFEGTTIFGTEAGVRIRSEIKLLPGGKLQAFGHQWNSEKDDLEQVSWTGVWHLEEAGKKRSTPSIVMTFDRDKKKKTYTFRVAPTDFQAGGFGLLKGNKAKKLERSYERPEYSDFSYLTFDTMECGD